MSKQPLTARQQQVLDFIKTFTRKHSYAPTIREIGKAIGITSTNGVCGHLDVLQKHGYITRPGKGLGLSRCIVVIDEEPARDEEDLLAALDGIERCKSLWCTSARMVEAVERLRSYAGVCSKNSGKEVK